MISLDARRDMRAGQMWCLPDAVKKLVMDMHYETCIHAIITYHTTVLGEKVTKKDARTITKDARTITLTWDQYSQVNT
jgi:hypothetical protein